MSHIFFAGVLELSLETYCCQDVLLAVFIVLRALARICLVWIRFSFVGCLLKFRKADFLLFIEFLTSLLNQGLFLFEHVEDFGIHFSATWINVSVKACISSAVLNISGFNFSLHSSIKFSQFALFKFHWEWWSSFVDSISSILIGKWSLPWRSSRTDQSKSK